MFFALAEVGEAASDFLRPAALEQAKIQGSEAVMRDENGNLTVDTKSVLGGELSQEHNKAAYASYLSQVRLDISDSMTELARKYEFDPSGFRKAADAYAANLAENAPPVLRGDIRTAVSSEIQSRHNGLTASAINRVRNQTASNTTLARDLAAKDAINIYMKAGDTPEFRAKLEEVKGISAYRGGAAFISETPEKAEAYVQEVIQKARAARFAKELADLGDVETISSERREQLESDLDNLDLSPSDYVRFQGALSGEFKRFDATAFVDTLVEVPHHGHESDGSFNWQPFVVGGGTRPDAISGLQPQFRGAMEAMIAAAPDHIRPQLKVTSAYRSVEVQRQLYENALRKYGSPAAARKWVAPPGNSRHNHGNAIDFSYGSDAARQWAHANAARFGLHFPMSWEPQHIEPIGSRSGQPVRVTSAQLASMAPRVRDAIDDPETQALALGQLNVRVGEAKLVESEALKSIQTRQAAGEVITEAEIWTDPNLAESAQIALVEGLQKSRSETQRVVQMAADLANPGTYIDISDTKSRNDIDKVFESSVPEGENPLESDVARGAATEIVGRTGYIPKPMRNALNAAVNSADPEQIQNSMEFLNTLQDIDPSVFNNTTGTNDLQKALDTYEFLTRFNSGADAAAELAERRLPENQERRGNMKEEVRAAQKRLESSDIIDHLDNSLWSDPGFQSPAQEAAIMAEYKGIFESEFLEANGDFDLAKDLALKKLGRIYGPSALNANTLMKYPPEQYHGTVNGSHDWMGLYLQKLVTELVGTVDVDTPGGVREGLIPQDAIRVTSDITTRKDVNDGRPPSYVIFYDRNGNGNFEDIEMLPSRFVFDRPTDQVRQDFEEFHEEEIRLQEGVHSNAHLEPGKPGEYVAPLIRKFGAE